ncbi:MAG: DNA mismatch repair protein MutS, partial [Phycisphaerales bacterium]|nr:DNA mismatch repair protein MutS [Phycisphaerales bacterium]
MPDPRETPAMQQYYRFKRAHPECVLLFRIGDFYELFDDDAVLVSRVLGLTLTQRTEGVPMAGFPFHQLDSYLRRLIAQRIRVAVAEQVQDPNDAKGVIERAVTRVLTPGTLVDESLVEADASCRLAAVCFTEPGDRPRAAVAVADLSTGDFTVFESTYESLVDELTRRSVSELLYADTADGVPPPRIKNLLAALNAVAPSNSVGSTPRPAWEFRLQEAHEALLRQFSVVSLGGFGLGDDDAVVQPAGAAIRYLLQTQQPDESGDAASVRSRRARPLGPLAHLRPPKRDDRAPHVVIDATTIRSLELLRTIRGSGQMGGGGDSEGSLLGVFLGSASSVGGGCSTPMGKRLLRDWLCAPLRDLAAIRARQHAVATLIAGRATATSLSKLLGNVQDIARIAARLALGRALPRDLVALGRSLAQLGAISEALRDAPAFAPHRDQIQSCADRIEPLAHRIIESCVASPPAHLREGGLFKDGFDAALDECRLLERDGATWLTQYQARLVEEHSLAGIKVGYNKVFGYFIELTKAQARSAPATFTRKQTLTGAERYITPELKEFEEKVTTARARAIDREQRLFDDLCTVGCACIEPINRFAAVCAELDVLACFADKAVRRQWVCPELVSEPALSIVQGRHPVLDELLGTSFVPNDAHLASSAPAAAPAAPSLALITGPNMAGKSTFIRQTALLALLAHVGSFVPADSAVIGLTDRIFTRVGASDDLSRGQSTFMVEMNETANIIHNATRDSVVILDEIGRGTSTFDGLSIAWSV